MPIELRVGPPVLTINQGSTFLVTDLGGEIALPTAKAGLFADDTRFMSHYRIYANGFHWQRISSAATTYHALRVHLTNPVVVTEDGDIAAETLALTIGRDVSEGMHEDLDLVNYGPAVRFNLEVAIRSDFADLFEVKGGTLVRRGRIVTAWDDRTRRLRADYRNADFARRLDVRVENQGPAPHYANGRITFEVALAPGATWHACLLYELGRGEGRRSPERLGHGRSEDSKKDELHRSWSEAATVLTSSNVDVEGTYRQGVEDLGALRLHDEDMAEDVWVPAAGVPWFVTLFGRDSLIASLQCMPVNCAFARGALRKLAQYQAQVLDDWRDAQPGKILHEIRFGELAHFHRIPHTPYYGTADATALYLITLHEAWRWLGELTLLQEHRATALRCLEWIDRYGDLDGDGFQEYATRSAQGYQNMGWKDHFDAVVDANGALVPAPKALCEIQGYTYDAWRRMAEVFDALGEPERSAALRSKAAALRERFEAAFWCEDLGTYAFALDPDKRQARAVVSNAGHLLWSGIVDPGRASRLVERLVRSDLRSGWGIRTISVENPAYNPLSYHVGSIWPHDNALIALGMARYGHHDAAAQVAQEVIDAASFFQSYRLPELYAGIAREPGTFPVQYRRANVPQAWAAGSVFHFVQALLGLRADAPNGRLFVDPSLPEWLPDITLRGMRVGATRISLRFWREAARTRWEVLEGDIAVSEAAWGPW
ncbi:MAG: amylo-alpha-1,6-glucosidase [Chloroflexota bacterium]|nr:amylo-alpha-1,6-glucosidase [Chloroflexota bacterium]